MKRWLLIGGGLLVLIIAVVVFYIYSSLGSIIKAAIEKYGSEATKTQVRLKGVDVSLSSAQGALRGLSVGNPAGFKTASAFRLGEISLTLDIGTVTSDTVVVKEIVVSATEVTYELGPQGNNIDAIKRNVDAYASSGRGKGEAKSQAKEEGGRKLIIENLYIRNGKVEIGSAFSEKTMSASLPDIHLTNIGKQKNGAAPGEVAEKVIGALSQAVAKAVASVDTSEVLGKAKQQLEGAKGAVEEKGKGAVDSLKKMFGN